MVERARWSRGDWLTMAGSALIVILIALLVAAVLVGVGGGSSAQAVTLEPASQSGADPFTASVQVGPAVALSQSAQAVTVAARSKLPADPKTHTLIAPATAPGLYGGSGDAHVCDPDQLVAFLQQHPGKAGAWAAVLGVNVSGIKTYVASLTPVVLTSDTLVTNHGYRDGRATTLTSVLQAGTAVMVDSYGVPRVKCNCGNPLTPPRPINPADFRGRAWGGYTPTQVTVVHSTTQVTNLTVINVNTGQTYTQATGSALAQFIASNDARISTSSDGARWTQVTSIPDRANALVAGGGKLLALANSVGQTIVWQVERNGSTHIALLPGTSASIAFGNGRWILSTVQSGASGGTGSLYTSTDATNWTKADVTVATADYGAGAGNRVPVAYGDGLWVAAGSQPSTIYTSRDGVHWASNGAHADYGYALALAFGNGDWVLGTDEGVITSHDSVAWTPAKQAGLRGHMIGSVAYGNGEWLATGFPDDPGSTVTPTLFSSGDAAQWTAVEQSMVPDALAFGATPFVANPSTPRTTPTTTQPAPTTAARSTGGIEQVDFRNYTYLDRTCGTFKGTHDPVKLVNGKYEGTDGYSNPPGTPDCGMTVEDVQFADVTGDGAKDAVVSGTAASENIQPWTLVWTTVFMATPSGPKNIGYLDGYAYPPYSAAAGINVWSGVIGSIRCCAATYNRVTYKYSGGKLVKTAQATDLPPSAAPGAIVKMMGGSG
jgi:hypothetical protein